ncbi:MAG: hypothetical protein O7A98_10020, partial [Acidobacteria bacterium]|nr:hypothetical protein [Acidobacteriota bacterium]
LPAFPFIALLLAWYLKLEQPPPSRLRAVHVLALSFAVSLGLLAADRTLAPPFPSSTDSRTVLLWVLLWLFAGAACWTFEAGRRRAAMLAALLLNAQFLISTLPAVAKSRSLIGRATVHAHRLSPERRLPIVLVSTAEDVALLQPWYQLPHSQVHPSDRGAFDRLFDSWRQLVVVSEPQHLDWLLEDPSYSVEMIGGRGHIFLVAASRATSTGPE